MNTRRGRRWAAPALVLLPTFAVVWWAFPEGLPLWRGVSIVTAWAGMTLLVMSLVLMIREPRFARLLGGLEASYRWHHRSGVIAYVLILCHPLALAVNGWMESPQFAWASVVPWAQSWPVWLGWVALVLLMFGLATTFALHLRYRRWRALHFSLGLGVMLGLAHVYVLLGGFVPLLLLMGVGIAALGWRIVASDLGARAQPYRVTEVHVRAAGMVETTLVPCASALAVVPGQFVLAAFGDGPHFSGNREYHPFTVSSVEADGRLRIAVKALGPCSQQIQSVEPGVMVRLQGPFGTFLAEVSGKPQLWVAGGIGITPFMAALRAGPCKHATTLIYLYRSAADAAFVEELQALAAADDRFELRAVATGSGLPDFEALLVAVHDLASREVHICGPAPMVNALSPHLQRAGLRANAIHYESFDFR